MITKTILFLLLVSFSTFAETKEINAPNTSCTIELFSKVYRFENDQALTSADIIHKTDCDVLINTKISQLISNATGTVGADFLKRELLKDFNSMTINISPRKLSFLDLNSTLRDQLTNQTNLYFLNSKSLNGIKTLGLLDGEQIKGNCESCNSFGEKNLKLDIVNPVQNNMKTYWFTTKIMAKVKVFKAKRSLSFQQAHLSPEDFYIDNIFSSNPDSVLTSLDNIHFYKANRNILQDSVVTNLDIQAVNLVNYGTPVSVILKNQNISLQKTVMPNRSALFGEVIELKNPNSNKIIAGKVVDYNKVVIEL